MPQTQDDEAVDRELVLDSGVRETMRLEDENGKRH